MSEARRRDWGVLRVNDIDRVAGIRPSLAEQVTRESAADIAQMRAGIGHNNIAIIGKTDANNKMSAAVRAFPFETIIGNGGGNWNARFDPVFEFRYVGEAADV